MASTANTYDWIIATAVSKVSSKIWVTRSNVKIEDERLGPWLPRRTKSKCPAIILAANRTASVPGRITFLIVSIKTIKGIKAGGVPKGTRWANICLVWLNHP